MTVFSGMVSLVEKVLTFGEGGPISCGRELYVYPDQLNYRELRNTAERDPSKLIEIAGGRKVNLMSYKTQGGITYVVAQDGNGERIVTPRSMQFNADGRNIGDFFYDLGAQTTKQDPREMMDSLFVAGFENFSQCKVFGGEYLFNPKSNHFSTFTTRYGDVLSVSSVQRTITEGYRAATIRLSTGLYQTGVLAFCEIEYWLHSPLAPLDLSWRKPGECWAFNLGEEEVMMKNKSTALPHGFFIFERDHFQNLASWGYLARPTRNDNPILGFKPFGAYHLGNQNAQLPGHNGSDLSDRLVPLLCLNGLEFRTEWGDSPYIKIQSFLERILKIINGPLDREVKNLFELRFETEQ